VDAVNRILESARAAAHAPGEYVDQESFMSASEIRRLAAAAGVDAAASVLDLCCGIAGPGRLVTREVGCSYLGVDRSPEAVRVARERAHELPCRFEVARVPPLPVGRFDVVLLLETMLAFPEKAPLLAAVAGALDPGGRFAFTVEEGTPLTEAERHEMPGADTVWLIPLDELTALLRAAGMVVSRQEELSASHAATAAALADAYAVEQLDELVASHRLWARWLEAGRVRKFAFVAEKRS
jgi:SAM-dependent methyltransferase